MFGLIFIFYILILFPRWHPFINDPSLLNQLDTDFIYYKFLYLNINDYQNILIENFVQHMVNKLGYLSGFAEIIGNFFENKLLAIYLIQLSLGFIGIYFICKAFGFSKPLFIIIILFFIYSNFSSFGRYIGGPGYINKVTQSCFVYSLVYLNLSLFLNQKNSISLLFSSILYVLHPSYSLILLFIQSSYHLYTFYLKEISFSKLIKVYIPSIIFLFYFFLFHNNISNELFLNDSVDWWNFLKSKTSNPFPLQDGLFIVITSLFIFYFCSKMYLYEYKKNNNIVFLKSAFIIISVLMLWLIQIFFTEVIPYSLITKLALTRSTPIALLFIVIIYLHLLLKHNKISDRNFFYFLLLVPFFLNKYSLFNKEIMTFLFNDNLFDYPFHFIGTYSSDFYIYLDIIVFFIYLMIFLSRMNYYKLAEKHIFILNLLKNIFIIINLIFLITGSYLLIGMNTEVKDNINLFSSCILFILSIFVLQSPYRINYKNNFIFINQAKLFKYSVVIFCLLFSFNLLTLNNIRTDNSANKFWNLINEKTEPNEMIAIIPFFNTRIYPVMPVRPIFLDWADSQFVLYDPMMLDKVKERLMLIGFDVNSALISSKCNNVMQYLNPMCKRKNFEELSKVYNEDWRNNILKMKLIAPNLKYVFIKKIYTLEADKVVGEVDDFVLIKI